MTNIYKLINKLILEYNTNSPKQLCESLNIDILYSDLGEHILGFTQAKEDGNLIHININSDNQDFVIAHELGHVLLHKDYSTFFLKRTSYRAVDKLEHEANEFATLLLARRFEFSNYECVTVDDIMRDCNIPELYREYLYNYNIHLIKENTYE